MITQNQTPRSSGFAGSRQERGQDMVEFAIVLPVLLLLILGIIEFGILVYDYNTISNAAREGARYGLIHPANEGPADCVAPSANTIVEAACNLTLALDRTQVRVQSSLMPIPNEAGRVTVTVWYRARLLTAPLLEVFGGAPALPLSTTTSMIIEP